MDWGLTNKVGWVTGGARGLGRALCVGLAEEGPQVAVNSIQTDPQILAAELKDRFRTAAIGVRGEVSNPAAVREVLDRIYSG